MEGPAMAMLVKSILPTNSAESESTASEIRPVVVSLLRISGPHAPLRGYSRLAESALRRWFLSAALPFNVVLLLCAGTSGPALAQAGTQEGQTPNTLDPVVVSPPKQRLAPQFGVGSGVAPKRAKPVRVATPKKPVPPVAANSEPVQTPLNTNVVATSASRLDLTVRETPATVEVV